MFYVRFLIVVFLSNKVKIIIQINKTKFSYLSILIALVQLYKTIT